MLPWSEQETPILSSLITQAARTRFPLHVPGHQQGRGLPMPLSQWLGAAAAIDLTELPGLDNLQHPSGCIAASQQFAAAHYGSDVCLFSVNGSSASVMAAIAGCVHPGGQVLFLNPFHVSAWRGLVFADAQPLLPETWFGPDADSCSIPNLETVAAVLEVYRKQPRLEAVYVTSPTYRGEVAPVAEIARLVHELGLPLIVDEAHGAHFGLHPGLPANSVQRGADVVIHSVHKTLPGLTQTGWIHCTGGLIAPERIADNLHTLQSTSPSYLLLASLDAAQAWLRLEGHDAAERALAVVAPLHPQTPAAAQLPQQDRLRHWVATDSYVESRQLQEQLAAAGFFVEYADAAGVLSMFGFRATPAVVEGYHTVVKAWQRTRTTDTAATEGTQRMQPLRASGPKSGGDIQLVSFAAAPRMVHTAQRHFVPLREGLGRIAAQPITPYPPGVPVVWPGQQLDEQVMAKVQWLSGLAGQGAEVQGIREDGCIAVVTESNARGDDTARVHYI